MKQVKMWNTEDCFPEPYLSWVKTYGGIVHYRVITKEQVQVTDPKAVQSILTTQSTAFPRDSFRRGNFENLLAGQGLLRSEGSIHDTQRKVLNGSLGVIYGQTLRWCSSVLDAAIVNGTPVNLTTELPKLTLNVIGFAAFDYDFHANPAAGLAYEELGHPLPLIFYVCISVIPALNHLPLPSLQRLNKARETLLRIVGDVIDHKLQAKADPMRPKDLLDLMLDAKVDSRDAIVHTMKFMFAGHETTSSALNWVIHRLTSHPTVGVKVREECQRVWVKYGAFDDWDALMELTYTTAVIQETLRLHPVACFLGRRVAVQDCNVPLSDGSSAFIPKGTIVLIPTFRAMHRDPKYWSQPQDFLPERFLHGSDEFLRDLKLRDGKNHPFHYLPFSFGSKNCIGQRLAMAELQVVIATLVTKYEFTPTPQTDTHHVFTGVTIHPVKLEMAVRPL
ncbi:hypothetical protein AC1031_001910 [Aphanomyces cochlioides]|nr:hypothetical protein AC1031_001910 [Aphanomyces cochlioides]